MKKTIADYPELVKEWHPTLNGDLMPCNVSYGSEKKIWWKCKKSGHEWITTPNARTYKKSGCPYCVNQKVCSDNCLATRHPEIAKELHPTLNGNLTSFDIITGSNKKYWWICKKGHQWLSTLANRTRRNDGCPYCSNHRVCSDNCLATKFPELAKEWHPTLNGNLTPSDIIAGTPKKHWWICDKGHGWQASCGTRTGKNKVGCSYCSNHRVCNDNCLATKFPELAKEWHPTLNGNLTPNGILAGTQKKHWWICNKGHEWQASCGARTGKGKSGCPYCSNHRVCSDNCLATKFPELAKEWHPTLNGNLIPNGIVAGTPKKYWWQCSENHEWKTSCDARITHKSGCPICVQSQGEKEIARTLDKLNIKYFREFKFDNCKNIKKLRFDFKLNINNKEKIIEYHGKQHYKPCDFGSKKICKHENLKGIQDRDKIKKDFCESRGIPFLEISYKDYDKIEELITKFVEI